MVKPLILHLFWSFRLACFAIIWTECGAGIYDLINHNLLCLAAAGTMGLATFTLCVTERVYQRCQQQ